MYVLAIDPGPEQSAWVLYDSAERRIPRYALEKNHDVLISLFTFDGVTRGDIRLAIEMVACYGMPVGRSVFETAVWIGRFYQRWMSLGLRNVELMERRQVKVYLCNSVRARDSNIRQALIDRLGPPGTKKNPGRTYGMKKDLWQALALAVTYAGKVEET